MPQTIRFDERVAIVTGAGGGLGRSHALALAQRGALVLVNDLGGSVQGQGGDQAAAQQVVNEITAAGGTALAKGDHVTLTVFQIHAYSHGESSSKAAAMKFA